MNGVPSLSSLDGWWLEGHIEHFTGWSIDSPVHDGSETYECSGDADCLYEKLQKVIVPQYYRDRQAFMRTMYGAIAINGAFFNTQRMVQQYVVKAYL